MAAYISHLMASSTSDQKPGSLARTWATLRWTESRSEAISYLFIAAETAAARIPKCNSVSAGKSLHDAYHNQLSKDSGQAQAGVQAGRFDARRCGSAFRVSAALQKARNDREGQKREFDRSSLCSGTRALPETVFR